MTPRMTSVLQNPNFEIAHSVTVDRPLGLRPLKAKIIKERRLQAEQDGVAPSRPRLGRLWLEGKPPTCADTEQPQRGPAERFEPTTGPVAVGELSGPAFWHLPVHAAGPPRPVRHRKRRAPLAPGLCGGGVARAKAGNRRNQLETILADLKLAGALGAVDDVLASADSWAATAGKAIELLLDSQIVLRNNRELQNTTKSE